MLGCELWMENFDSLFALVKEYIIDLLEVRKAKGKKWYDWMYFVWR